jgi:hypothetical protein
MQKKNCQHLSQRHCRRVRPANTTKWQGKPDGNVIGLGAWQAILGRIIAGMGQGCAGLGGAKPTAMPSDYIPPRH